jgi:hypothetical protein
MLSKGDNNFNCFFLFMLQVFVYRFCLEFFTVVKELSCFKLPKLKERIQRNGKEEVQMED